MKNVFLTLAVFLALALSVTALLRSPASGGRETAYERVLRTMTLRCGWMLAPPFVAVDPNTKKLSGLNIDYTERMAQIFGLTLTWQEIITGQQVEALRMNKVDAICGGEAPMVASLSLYLRYSEPLAYFPINMYAREGDTRFDGSLDKAIETANTPNMTVAFMDGDTSQDFSLQIFQKAKRHELPSTVDMSQIYLDLTARKADFVIEDSFTAGDFMKNNPGKLRQVILDKTFAIIPIQISMLRDEEALSDLLNQGIRLMRQRGFEDAILSRYERDYPGSFYRAREGFAPPD